MNPKNKKISSVWDKDVKVEENGYYWKEKPVVFKSDKTKWDKPIVVELFSGCGGTSTGFEMAGYDVALGIDIHKPSIETFRKNHPNANAILGDIKKINPELIEKMFGGRKVDVLIAGIPCQGFSLNNRKRHANDERNFLFKESVRFIKCLKPRVVVVENVSGINSTSNGKFVRDIETEISKAGNYVVKSQLLYAPDYGVPQKRRRMVFVGVKNEDGFNFDKIKKTNGPGTENPYVTVWNAIGDLPNLRPKESAEKYNKGAFSQYQKLMRGSVKKLTNHLAPNHPQETIDKIAKTKPGKPMYSQFKQRIRLKWDDLSPTQVSGGIRPQFQFGHPRDSRGLSIRERCRMQSFPDTFEICGGLTQGRVQTGNAVPPLLAKAIALALKKYL
jgi:DNA (cytosine-5)-methyltransferase 1